jgi:uroporphyrin-III C-methyltransferase / precorrin-2 dehydrogenase / sirohydrochlorin ferrochelatase
MSTLFPLFLKTYLRKCVVVGAGRIAAQKIEGLLDSGAVLDIVAPEASQEIQELARSGKVSWIKESFKTRHLDDALLVIAATGNSTVNEEVYRVAHQRGVLCNSVDEPERCDFFYPAVVRRGNLQIAISTGGKSPALAQRIRKELEEQFDSSYIGWLNWLGSVREMFFRRKVEPELRKQMLHRISSSGVFDRFTSSRTARTMQKGTIGKVFLVGAGPGDPELLTLRAAHLLQKADIILHDALVSAEILALVRTSRVINIGKRCGTKLLTQQEINALLVSYASEYKAVVRLKGGDPSIFGRVAEEVAALVEVGIPYEIVPGVTSAIASAAAAGISLTDRRFAASVVFATAHRGQGADAVAWNKLVTSNSTLAIYMPGSDHKLLADQLCEAGLDSQTCCVLVSHTGHPTQQVRWCNLKSLKSLGALPAPSLLIVGECARSLHVSDYSILRDLVADEIRPETTQ